MTVKRKRFVKILIVIFCIALIYIAWHFYNQTLSFHIPEYEKTDISQILKKDLLTDDDYMLIFKNTGVSPGAAKDMIENDQSDVLIELNNLYFTKPEIYKNYIAYPVTLEEQNKTQVTPLVPLKKGDILVTFNTQTLEWRHGHCGLVMDDDGRIILEHAAIGHTSGLSNSSVWGEYPAFAVLRYPDPEVSSKAADYANENLIDIDYRITAGVIDKDKTGEDNLVSHCSHIVWQAYKSVGVDIDADKSFIVSPKDVALSPELEVVQIFGIDPKDYESRIIK